MRTKSSFVVPVFLMLIFIFTSSPTLTFDLLTSCVTVISPCGFGEVKMSSEFSSVASSSFSSVLVSSTSVSSSMFNISESEVSSAALRKS